MNPTREPWSEKQYLETCLAIEQNLAELYRLLADKPTHDVELKSLWSRSADEKDHRAHQFQLAQMRAVEEGGELALQVPQVRATLAFATSILDQARLAHLSPTLSLRLAIRLEESTEHAHSQAARSANRASTRRTLKAMLNAQRTQRGQLEAALHHRLARAS